MLTLHHAHRNPQTWSIYEVTDYLGCGSYGSRVVPGGRVHFMIAEKSSDVKVKRVSRLAESKSRCCISHNFGGFYQIIPCIRLAVVRIKVAHGYPATIRIFILGPRGAGVAEGARRATNAAALWKQKGQDLPYGKGVAAGTFFCRDLGCLIEVDSDSHVLWVAGCGPDGLSRGCRAGGPGSRSGCAGTAGSAGTNCWPGARRRGWSTCWESRRTRA